MLQEAVDAASEEENLNTGTGTQTDVTMYDLEKTIWNIKIVNTKN